MKFFTPILFLIPFFAQAQTPSVQPQPVPPPQQIDYSIFAPSKDSFFLVESVTGAVSKDVPKPQTIETFQLFRSEAQLSDYVKYLRSQAAEARKQSITLSEQSKKLIDAAPKIDASADKIEAVLKENAGFFRADNPKVKPKKKKS